MIFVSFPLGGCADEAVSFEQIIKGTNMFICFSITYWQSSISWMVKEFVVLSEKLFLMYTFAQARVDDDVN